MIDLSIGKPSSGTAAAVFSGISAAVLSFMLPVSLIITVFGQFGDRRTADILMFPMIILSVASSAFIDVHFYLKYPAKTAYPIMTSIVAPVYSCFRLKRLENSGKISSAASCATPHTAAKMAYISILPYKYCM